jgi:dihydroorotate dehydrogenase (fumarate)
MNLETEYLGLRLRTPLVASPSPLTTNLGGLRRLEDGGASGVVLHSLFEEEIMIEALQLEGALEAWATSFGEAPQHFAELEDVRTLPDQYLDLVREAKESLEIPVMASLNVSTPGPWIDQAKLIEQAGADALELTFFTVAANPELTGAEIEARYREIVAQVRQAVRIPVAVKLAPFFTALARLAAELVDAGADGLVLFHRGYQPYLDLESLEVSPRMMLSTSGQVLLPLRWIAILRDAVSASLGATGGVHNAHDAMRLLLAGADVVMMSSALVEEGPAHVKTVERDLVDWMTKHEYDSMRQLIGSASQNSVSDPSAFERVSYVKTLKSLFGRLVE